MAVAASAGVGAGAGVEVACGGGDVVPVISATSLAAASDSTGVGNAMEGGGTEDVWAFTISDLIFISDTASQGRHVACVSNAPHPMAKMTAALTTWRTALCVRTGAGAPMRSPG
jgi:hypothetical protein